MGDARRNVAERAEAIYDERIRPLVEKEHFGKVISIDVNSGDYEIAEGQGDQLGAIHRLRARHADPKLVGMRIGIGPVGRVRGFRATHGKPE